MRDAVSALWTLVAVLAVATLLAFVLGSTMGSGSVAAYLGGLVGASMVHLVARLVRRPRRSRANEDPSA